ncbi:MAG: hypothetical protein C1O27_002072 [Chloroflexi bacterium]|jgi:hypothetical protein|nr:MAG: hypothetical protein C1O27_002072 [Chloroflexota bacterium]
MESICQFALFAERVALGDAGLDIEGVHSEAILSGFPRRAEGGFTKHEFKLFIGIYADAGQHTLSVALPPTKRIASVTFDIEPHHNNQLVLEVGAAFPMIIAKSINRYPLLLDGEPFGEAHMRSIPEYDPN